MILCDKYYMNDAKYFYFFCLPTCNIMNYVGNIPYICFFVYYSYMLTFGNRCKTSLKPARVEQIQKKTCPLRHTWRKITGFRETYACVSYNGLYNLLFTRVHSAKCIRYICHLIFTIILQDQYYFYPHFTNEETEDQRNNLSQVTQLVNDRIRSWTQSV